jgi:antitoxin CptB
VSKNDIGRLRWRCRRGMLELDAALTGFLDNAYPTVTPELRQAFSDLLVLEDAEILDLLHGAHPPATAAMAVLLPLIRAPIRA